MEATQRDGMTTFLEERWWVVKWFGTTNGAIVLALGVILLLASFMAGIKFDRSRNDMIPWGDKSYMLVGLAELPGANGVYIPVYRDVNQLKRERGR